MRSWWNFTLFALFHNDLNRHHIVKCWTAFIMQHEYQFPTKLATCALRLRGVDMADVVLATSGILTASRGCILYTKITCAITPRYTIFKVSVFEEGSNHVTCLGYGCFGFFPHIWYLNNTNCAVLFLLHSITWLMFCRHPAAVSVRTF